MESIFTPADHVMALLHEYAPHAAPSVEPFITRLFNALDDGHSFIFVNADEQTLLAAAHPIVGTPQQPDSPLVLHGKRLFLARFFQLEQQLAHEINRLSEYTHPITQPEQLAQSLRQLFPDASSRDQQAAAALAWTQNFTVISGGPGTGKTTTVAKLLVLLSGDQQPRIALAAPTGKAAARMSEALNQAIGRIPHLAADTAAFLSQLNGQTVHRLLGLQPPQMLPEYHAQHRLPLDIVVVDEASMLDVYLLWQLLRALPSHCRVILLGDEHQLPSVSAGAVLAALVRSHFRQPESDFLRTFLSEEQLAQLTPPIARLRISHRFGADSGIGCLARAVMMGNGEEAWAQFARFPHELTVQSYAPTRQAMQLYQHHQAYWQAIDAEDVAAAFRHQADVAVLTARRADAEQFNQHYRQIAQQHQRARADAPWFAGQMLMITRNDAATQLFNGDIGIVLAHGDRLAAWFPDRQGFRAVPLSRLPAHEPAFAMTVHKSQGSEYHEVWFVPPRGEETHFSRALLYTAITRAKQKFVYWGDEQGFQAACRTPDVRRTLLAEWLRN